MTILCAKPVAIYRTSVFVLIGASQRSTVPTTPPLLSAGAARARNGTLARDPLKEVEEDILFLNGNINRCFVFYLK